MSHNPLGDVGLLMNGQDQLLRLIGVMRASCFSRFHVGKQFLEARSWNATTGRSGCWTTTSSLPFMHYLVAGSKSLASRRSPIGVRNS